MKRILQLLMIQAFLSCASCTPESIPNISYLSSLQLKKYKIAIINREDGDSLFYEWNQTDTLYYCTPDSIYTFNYSHVKDNEAVFCAKSSIRLENDTLHFMTNTKEQKTQINSWQILGKDGFPHSSVFFSIDILGDSATISSQTAFIAFSVPNTEINTVVITSSCDQNGTTIKPIEDIEVALSMSNGNSFDPTKTYIATVAPGIFRDGITISYYTDSEFAQYNDNKYISLKMGDCYIIEPEKDLVFKEYLPTFENTISISTWPYGKKKALSFTWDDGQVEHVEKISDIFNEFGYKTTFFIPTLYFPYDEYLIPYRKLLKDGHEIGSHTVDHTPLLTVSPEEAFRQIVQSSLDIYNTFGFYPASFAHPNRQFNEIVDSIIVQYYLASRFSSIIEYPDRMVHTIVSSDNYGNLKDELFSLIEDEKKWIVYSGHGLSGEGIKTACYQPINIDELYTFLQYIKTELDDLIYIDSFENIVMYELLRKQINVKYSFKQFSLEYNNISHIIDKYSHPNVVISLELPLYLNISQTNSIIDRFIRGDKQIITMDLRRNNIIKYE